MITKRVNRYYCEHCKKAGQVARHIERHERHCTMNPFRICRVCPLVDSEQQPIRTLMAVLPEESIGTDWEGCELSNGWPGIDEAVKKLRDLSGGCPACMMAALRQKGIPVPAASEFDFKADMAGIFQCVSNAARQEERDRELSDSYTW